MDRRIYIEHTISLDDIAVAMKKEQLEQFINDNIDSCSEGFKRDLYDQLKQEFE